MDDETPQAICGREIGLTDPVCPCVRPLGHLGLHKCEHTIGESNE